MSLRITFGLVILTIIFICSNCEYYGNTYTVPEPLIEAFEPRGLRVSIPHISGIHLFAFHGNINKELKDVDAGELSKDIIKKTGSRWVYENKNIKLKVGDNINFWLFVIKNNLGYKSDRQSFVIDILYPVPENFLTNQKPNKRPSYSQSTPKPKPTTPRPQTTNIPCPVCPACSTTPPTTTPLPAMTTSSTVHEIVNIWTASLNNATEEKTVLTKQIQELEALNEQLLKKLDLLGYGNDKRLIMSGRLPTGLDPEMFVETVLRDKLLLKDRIIKAERNPDNTITFEMETFTGKLNVLKIAKEKLANSQLAIDDHIERVERYDAE